MSTTHDITSDDGLETSEANDRPSFMRVESFLGQIEDRRRQVRRTRWLALAVATVIGGVATLTAMGIVPVEAENAVLSASAVVSGFALSKD
jgi:hypothetical protein